MFLPRTTCIPIGRFWTQICLTSQWQQKESYEHKNNFMSPIHRTLMMKRNLRSLTSGAWLWIKLKKMTFYFSLSESFLSGIDNYILSSVQISIKMTRSNNQFVLLHNTVSSKSVENFSLKLSPHLWQFTCCSFVVKTSSESKSPCWTKLHNMTKKTIAKTFVISESTSIYYKGDMFDSAPVSRLVFAMVPRRNFTGDNRKNPLHFRDFDLGSVKCTREGALVGPTPTDVNSSHIRAYFKKHESSWFWARRQGIDFSWF